MTVSRFAANIQRNLEKNVGSDLRNTQTKMDENTKGMELGFMRQDKLELNIKAAEAAVQEAKEDGEGILGTLLNVVGDDCGLADAKKALQDNAADLEKTANTTQLKREEGKELTGQYSTTVSEAGSLTERIGKVLQMDREARLGE